MGKEYVREYTILGLIPTMGPVVLWDDMEDLFKWAITGNAGDFAGTKETTLAYNGLACMKLTTRVTNPIGGDWVQALRSLYQRPGKRYAVECIWRPESASNVGWVRFHFDMLDGVDGHHGTIICDVEGARWYYRRSDGGEVELPNSPKFVEPAVWHRLRLEFNQNSGKYIKLIADGQEVDMSALSYQKMTNAGAVKAEAYIKVANVTTAAGVVYVDDFLVLEI